MYSNALVVRAFWPAPVLGVALNLLKAPMRHLISFLRSPVGYIANLLATLTVYTGSPAWIDRPLCKLCDTFCVPDGVQNDPLF